MENIVVYTHRILGKYYSQRNITIELRFAYGLNILVLMID